MLWEAGQERIVREGRERLAELYIGVRDGYVAGNLATGKVSARGDITPPYLDAPAGPPTSAARQDMVLARLAAMFPGSIRRGES